MHAVDVVGDGQASERGGHGEHIPPSTGIHEMSKAAHEAGLDAVACLGLRPSAGCTAEEIGGERGLIRRGFEEFFQGGGGGGKITGLTPNGEPSKLRLRDALCLLRKVREDGFRAGEIMQASQQSRVTGAIGVRCETEGVQFVVGTA
jgi:hypothetical protein